MKKLVFLIIFLSLSSMIVSQTRSEERIIKANNFYKQGKELKALKLWKKAAKSVPTSSSTYGKAIRNILYYYSRKNDASSLVEYYNKMMEFELNSIEKKQDIGASFINTKYHITLLIARYFKNKGDLEKAIFYLGKADNSIFFSTNSKRAFCTEKNNLALWKYNIYKELGKHEIAFSILLKRAFESNYKVIQPSETDYPNTNKESELSKNIYAEIEDLKAFKNDLDKSISNLQYDTKNNQILLNYGNIEYKIAITQPLDISKSKTYLKNTQFYKLLSLRTKNTT